MHKGQIMNDRDQVAQSNRKLWEQEVEKGCGYTIPWLDVDIATLHHYVQGKLEFLPEPLTCMYPADIFANVSGKDVICLASGGGQQSVVFGLLGASVTVVDFCDGQLAGDRQAAEHYGYPVSTIQADMRDLSMLAEKSFDIVYQANSVAYVPSIRDLYSEVKRIIKPGGLYRVCINQPSVQFVDWDGEKYFISKEYKETTDYRKSGVGVEFRHYMDDIFNGLLESGFTIKSVHESPFIHLACYTDAPPGTWNHQRSFVAGEFVIIAEDI